jgi:hypothetical protein
MLRVPSTEPSAPPAAPRGAAGSFYKNAVRRLSALSVILLPLLGMAAVAPSPVAPATAPGGAAAGGPAVAPAVVIAPAVAPALAAVPAVAGALAMAPLGTDPRPAGPAADASSDQVLPQVISAARRGVAGLPARALAMALDAVSCARARGIAGKADLLTLIDYSLPSTEPRLWVLDLAHGKVLFHELVAHGAGSGDNYATRFSNAMNSRQTSLGLFLTGGTYEGGNGYSLKLRGLDAGLNDLAEERNIVIHGAWYVTADHVRQYGRLGRSWGCPALPLRQAHAVIDTIKGGSFVYSYAGTRSQVAQAALHTASRCTPAARPAPVAAPLAPLATAIATALPAGKH